MAKGTLIAAMKIGRAAEDEFHDWYDTEHLPERQRVPGFLVCQRWIGADDPKISVATYDLDNVAVLRSPAYLAIGGENLARNPASCFSAESGGIAPLFTRGPRRPFAPTPASAARRPRKNHSRAS